MQVIHKAKTPAWRPVTILLLAALGLAAPSHAQEPRVALARQAAAIPALRTAHVIGHLDSGANLHLALTLPLRNQAQLTDLLHHLYTPGDPQQGKFLTPAQFAAQFSPTQQDYDAVASFARSQGLTITAKHSGRTVLEVAGSTSTVESAFGVTLNQYKLEDGRVVYANKGTPTVPQSIAARLEGVAGLNNVVHLRPHFHLLSPHASAGPKVPVGTAPGIGSGPLGGLAPNDIKFAYSLSGITPLYTSRVPNAPGTGAVTPATAGLLDGSGQTVGLFELDGFDPNDIAMYVNQFGLPTALNPRGANATPVLQAVPVGQPTIITPVSGAGGGQGEVTLDIDMVLALAPNIQNIYVYEGDQTVTPTIAATMYNTMADAVGGDGLPLLKVICSCWGTDEPDLQLLDSTMALDPTIISSENTAFQKMAAQGQSMFAASGDFGAYDAFVPAVPPLPAVITQPAVDDPASQPFVTGVGGTSLQYIKPTVASATTGGAAATNGMYVGETVWGRGSQTSPTGPEGSGGGISQIWTKPDYQLGLGASPLRRDVPDVALNADEDTGYDIYVTAVPVTTGGTSAAAPLWAAFAALVNQQRTLNGLTTNVGFVNPTLYAIARTTAYTSDFHDITIGDNLFYPATPGYDDATGLGSFVGNSLLTALSFNADQGTQTATLTGTVTDSSGVPVVNATVTAASTATGAVKATTVTDSNGNYTLTVPGALSLNITVDTSTVTTGGLPGIPGATGTTTGTSTVQLAGQVATGVTVTTGQTQTLSFKLNAAEVFAATLQMISAPFDFSGISDFPTLFGLTSSTVNANPRPIQWEPLLNSYVFYPTPPADMLRPGQGYWIEFPTANYLHREGRPISTTQPFRISLQQGWNQIGDPFLGSVPLSTITVDLLNGATPGALASSTVVSPTLYKYNGTAYVALKPATDTLDPYNGYWVFAAQTATLILPPVTSTVNLPPGIPGAP